MSDPISEMLIEFEREFDSEVTAKREERTILLQRITELQGKIAELSKAVDLLSKLRSGGSYTITDRDDLGRIKAFRVN